MARSRSTLWMRAWPFALGALAILAAWLVWPVTDVDETATSGSETRRNAVEAATGDDEPSSPSSGYTTTTAILHGRVVDSLSEPLPGVDLHVGSPQRWLASSGAASAATTRSDGKGEYRFDDLRPGDVVVVARRNGGGAVVTSSLRLAPGEQSLELTFPATAEISGRVVGPDDIPIENATVECSRHADDVGSDRLSPAAQADVGAVALFVRLREDRAVHEVRTAADGTFLLRALTVGNYALRAHTAGFGTGRLPAVRAGSRDVVFRLEPAVKLRGRVVLTGGEAVSGAEIEAYARSTAAADPWTRFRELANRRQADADARSLADGSFELDGLSPGPHLLRVEGAEIETRILQGVTARPGDDSSLIIEVTPGQPIAGRVVDPSGEGIANVPLTLAAGRGWLATRLESVTAPDGRFLFQAPGNGNYSLEATPPESFAPARVEGIVPGDVPLELRLQPARDVAGTVVDGASGAAIPGARVRWLGDTREDHIALTAANGAFHLRGVPLHDVEIEVVAGGYVVGHFDLSAAQGSPVRFELDRAGALGGVVLDEEGAPVDGAWLRLYGAGRGEVAGGPVLSGPDGRFFVSLAGSRAGSRYLLRARHAGFCPHDGTALTVDDPTAVLDGIEVTLKEGGSLAGRVLAGGRPLSGVTVRLRVLDGELVQELHDSALTDVDGRYSFTGLQPQEHLLRVDALSYAPYQSQAIPVLAAEQSMHDIFLEPEARITGRVVDEAGAAVAGAEVRGISSRHDQKLFGQRLTASDQDGVYALGSLDARRYRVEVRKPGFAVAAQMIVAPAELVDFVLRPYGEIAGRVTTEAGEPVREFRLSLTPATADDRVHERLNPRGFKDSEGRFVLPRIPPGRYRVEVAAQGFRPAREEVEVRPATRTPDLLFGLERGFRLLAVVVDDLTRQPISGANVRPLRAIRGKPVPLQKPPVFTTDVDGRVDVTGLDRVPYILEASHESYLAARSAPVDVDAADDEASATVIVALRPGGRIRGTVTRPDGALVPDGHVFLTGPGGVRSVPVEGGAFTFGGLEDGRYKVWLVRERRPQGQAVSVVLGPGDRDASMQIVAGTD